MSNVSIDGNYNNQKKKKMLEMKKDWRAQESTCELGDNQ